MLKDLPLDKIRPSATNPRKTFDSAKLQELADSIRAHGVLQPILVRPARPETDAPVREILAGIGTIKTAKAVEQALLDRDITHVSHLLNRLGHVGRQEAERVVAELGIGTHLAFHVIDALLDYHTGNEQTLGYELVAGERRWRASKLAGVETIRAEIRELTDRQVLEVQVIENEQRDDVAPLEKADAYARLMENHGVTVDEIAERVGKSKATVYGLVKLRTLSLPARKAMLNGWLSLSVAQLVARVPNAELRDQFAREAVAGDDYYTDCTWEKIDEIAADQDGRYFAPLSYRDAKGLLHNKYQVELKGAKFSRKALDLVDGAGSCDACPKRTGNLPDAEQGGRADVCTDPACFRAKEAAYDAKALAKLSKQGVLPVPKDINLWWHDGQLQSERFVALDQTPDYPPTVPKEERKTYGELVGHCKGVSDLRQAAIDDKGKARVVVLRKAVEQALEAEGLVNTVDRDEDDAPAEPKYWEIERVAKDAAVRAIQARATDLSDYLDRVLVPLNPEDIDPVHEMLRLLAFGVPNGDLEEGEKPEEWVKAASPSQLLGFLVGSEARNALTGYVGKDRKDAFLTFGEIDWDALCKKARKDLMKPKPKAKPKKAAAR